MDAKSKRQAALEEKKRRLQELKERRKRTQQQQQKQKEEDRTSIDSITRDDRSILTSTTSNSNDSTIQQQQQQQPQENLDAYITTLLSSPKPVRKKLNNNNNDVSLDTTIQNTSTAIIDKSNNNYNIITNDDNNNNKMNIEYEISKPKPNKIIETFEIGTQTEIEYDIIPYISSINQEQKKQHQEENDNNNDNNDNNDDEVISLQVKNKKEEKSQEEITKKSNNNKSIQVVEQQESFNNFLQKASLKVERLLDTYTLSDVLLGNDYYSIPDNKEKDNTIDDNNNNISCEPIISLSNSIVSSNNNNGNGSISNSHILSDYQFSKFHKELIIASYTNSDDIIHYNDTTDGVVLLYNLHLSSTSNNKNDNDCCHRPEHILHSTSGGVTSATFHSNDPNIILGGCSNGDLLLWDVRLNTRLPVSTSKQQPINTTSSSSSTSNHNNIDWYSISCIECSTKDNDIIYAITNTGSLVVYSLHQLSIPIHTIPISDFGLSCMTQTNDTIMCGDDIGTLYSIASPTSSTTTTTTAASSSSTTTTSKNNNHVNHLSNQHYGMITDISCNKNNNIIASSGIDWKTNIYYNDTTMYSSTTTSKQNDNNPTTSIKHMISICKDYEIISSCCFHPTIPSMLLQSTYNGMIQCYDLSSSSTTTKNNNNDKSNYYIEQQDPIIAMNNNKRNIHKIRFNHDGSLLGSSSTSSNTANNKSNNSLLDIYSFHINGHEFKEEVMMEHFVSRGLISSHFMDDEDDDEDIIY